MKNGTKIIDIFCHAHLQRFLSAYFKDRIPEMLSFLDVKPNLEGEYLVSDKARLEYMDKFGIDIEVLSMSQAAGIWQSLPQERLLEFAKLSNDSLSEFVSKHRDRMVPIATLPSMDNEFVDELDRCIQDLGMKGCMIFSNVQGRPIDSDEFGSFYERMSRYDLPVFIHPTPWKYPTHAQDHRLGLILGWPFDTSVAISRLVLGGTLERLPNLKIVVHHLGGMIPFFFERLNGHYEWLSKPAEKLAHNPEMYFKRLYGDTVVNGSMSALRCGYEFFGADHVVFGTDYPFGPNRGEDWTKLTIENVRRLDVGDLDKQKIFCENATTLLKLD